MVSSVKLFGGVTVTLYEHYDASGVSEFLSSDSHQLGATQDKVSHVEIHFPKLKVSKTTLNFGNLYHPDRYVWTYRDQDDFPKNQSHTDVWFA